MGWRGRNVQFTNVPRHVFADPPYVPALEPPAQSLAQDVLIPAQEVAATARLNECIHLEAAPASLAKVVSFSPAAGI